MFYLEDFVEMKEYINKRTVHREQNNKKTLKAKKHSNSVGIVDDERISRTDLDIFFRSIGSTFITYITSSTLNNLLSSKLIESENSILCNNSLLTIFASTADMTERCRMFNKDYGAPNGIKMECSIWHLSYFNMTKITKYDHQMMMKMIMYVFIYILRSTNKLIQLINRSYICINGMHPFLGIDCDNSPNCQWSNNPQCRVRAIFERLLANKDFYNLHEYDFSYRDAWRMKENGSKLLIDVDEMMQFLFSQPVDLDDDFESFENDEFTLFTFKNECDWTYKIQFDIIHCDSDLNVIDDFKISLFGKQIRFGSFCTNNSFKSYWDKIKTILLGHQFVNIQSWYVISIKHIDTSVHGNEHNKRYYLICAEVEGTYLNCRNAQDAHLDHMYSKLLVWKSCFFSEKQPYGHE